MEELKFCYFAIFEDKSISKKIFTLSEIEKLTHLKIIKFFSKNNLQPIYLLRKQYTNLKDINKKEIYDNDIVRIFPKQFVTNGFLGEVKITYDGVFVLGFVEEGKMSEDFGLLSSFDFEKIGNTIEGV